MSVLKGNVVQTYGKFKDKHGTFIDPTVVSVKVTRPDETSATYVYGSDDEVVKESTGVYYINIDTTPQPAGDWIVKWFSTGTGQGVAEVAFEVVNTQT